MWHASESKRLVQAQKARFGVGCDRVDSFQGTGKHRRSEFEDGKDCVRDGSGDKVAHIRLKYKAGDTSQIIRREQPYR